MIFVILSLLRGINNDRHLNNILRYASKTAVVCVGIESLEHIMRVRILSIIIGMADVLTNDNYGWLNTRVLGVGIYESPVSLKLEVKRFGTER